MRALPRQIRAAVWVLVERAGEFKRAGHGPDKELRMLVDAVRDAYEPDDKVKGTARAVFRCEDKRTPK